MLGKCFSRFRLVVVRDQSGFADHEGGRATPNA
jgi:hypothetical protein